jgi:hypothetical protein
VNAILKCLNCLDFSAMPNWIPNNVKCISTIYLFQCSRSISTNVQAVILLVGVAVGANCVVCINFKKVRFHL